MLRRTNQKIFFFDQSERKGADYIKKTKKESEDYKHHVSLARNCSASSVPSIYMPLLRDAASIVIVQADQLCLESLDPLLRQLGTGILPRSTSL